MGDRALDLTVSEFNLAALLIQNLGRAISKDEMSLQALTRKRSHYDRGIDVHISNLRQKLVQAAGSPCGLQTVRGIGYRMEVAE